MTSQNLHPLEYLLQLICTEAANFPTPSNHFQKYTDILGNLRSRVYNKINTGLAALSEVSGLYTDHSAEHFDEVVLHAGILLGLYRNADADKIKDKVISGNWILTPYEIYILLLSIRLHDVGNIFGREKHEQHINKVIHRFDIVHLKQDRIEANMVASIAGAHGGKTPSGDKDTIGKLQQSEDNGHIFDINNKKIAAITRLADEICENRLRVDIEGPDIPEHNLVFHKYAASINSNTVKNGSLYLRFQFKVGDLKKSYTIKEYEGEECISKNVTLPDITLSRLKKAELERRYCNRFMPESIQIKDISVAIEIIEDEKDEESFKHETLDNITFTLKEGGYPLDEFMFDEKTRLFMSYDRICGHSTGGKDQ